MTNIAKIDSQAIEPIQYKVSIYRADMPANMSEEDLLKPEAWVNVKRKFPQITTGDLIQCVKEDVSLFIELFVIGGTKDTLFVKVIRSVQLEEGSEEEIKANTSYRIKFLGPVKKHAVIRESDGEELVSGISSKIEAEQWIKTNI